MLDVRRIRFLCTVVGKKLICSISDGHDPTRWNYIIRM